jgi:hypothetical protein
MAEHMDNVMIASDDPSVQEWVPVHRVLAAEPMKEWIWIR